MAKSKGKIIIKPGLNVWLNEFITVETLAAAGYPVEFVRKSDVIGIE